MNIQENVTDRLTKLKNRVTDFSLGAGIIFVLVGHVLSGIRADNIWNDTVFIIQSIVILYITLVVIFRKRISLRIKILSIMLVIVVVMISALLDYGFLASSKVYIIILPVFLSFIISYRSSVISLLILMLIYITFAVLYTRGYLDYSIDANSYISSYNSWSIDGVILFLTSFGLLYIGKFFSEAISKNLSKIQSSNAKLERRKKKLKESENRYKTLVESFPDIIMISDLEGNIVYGNQHLTDITGITEDDYRNKERLAHIHPDDMPFVSKMLSELIRSDKTQSDIIENRFIDVNDDIHWLSGTMSKVYLEGQLYIQTVSRDISEKKQVELELENHRNNLEKLVKERTLKLESANNELNLTMQHLKETQSHLIQSEKMASLGVLTAGVAHEINNPLNFIKGGYLGLDNYFKEEDIAQDKDILTFLEGIKTGVDRATDIVKGLNQFSRDNENYVEECDIHSIIDNCFLILKYQLKDKIEIHKEFCDKRLLVPGNVGKLHQVFINIIINANQAIEQKGKISVSTFIVGEEIIIEISDNGRGISEEDISRITDPFFTTKDPGEGTGLGLSITYSIIQEHGGNITFNSTISEGTTVRVQLPKG